MARKSRYKQEIKDIFPKKSTLISAWIYARLSNENDHSESSIEAQIAICEDYINSNSELTFGGVFSDLGYSGTNFQRPGYSDMMNGILCGTVKCVVVKDLSRLGRAYIEVGELLFDTFIKYGVRFISVNENYDSFIDSARRKKLFILVKNLFNYAYSLDLKKKIISAINLKKQKGEPLGLAPYGYRRSIDKKCFEIDCCAAETIKMIFDMRVQGKSAYNIAKYLNQNNILSPQHYQLNKTTHKEFLGQIMWSSNAVSRILRNETYTGSLIQNKYAHNKNSKRYTALPKEQWVIKEHTHSGIISKEQFEAVAQLMQKSAKKYKRKNQSASSENRYWGKIFCSRCGKMAVRCENRQRDCVSFYYICRYCIDEVKHENILNRASNMPIDKLDIIVMETLGRCMSLLPKFENMAEVLPISDLFRQKKAKITRDRTECEKTISDYENSLLMAYTHHLSGLLDIGEYMLVRDKILSDKLTAEAQLEQITKEQEKCDVHYWLNNQWLVNYSKFRYCKTPTKEMIQTLIGRILITPLSNEINIELKFMDSFKELRQLIHECMGIRMK